MSCLSLLFNSPLRMGRSLHAAGLLKLPCSFDLGAWAFLSHGGVRERKRTLLNLRGPEESPKKVGKIQERQLFGVQCRTIPQRLWNQSSQRPSGGVVNAIEQMTLRAFLISISCTSNILPEAFTVELLYGQNWH